MRERIQCGISEEFQVQPAPDIESNVVVATAG